MYMNGVQQRLNTKDNSHPAKLALSLHIQCKQVGPRQAILKSFFPTLSRSSCCIRCYTLRPSVSWERVFAQNRACIKFKIQSANYPYPFMHIYLLGLFWVEFSLDTMHCARAICRKNCSAISNNCMRRLSFLFPKHFGFGGIPLVACFCFA